MRLATRCPSCTTMFLVVPDQLRVSDGWVRCGRCGNVFNAGESLLDVDTGIPAQLDLSRPTASAAPDGADPGSTAPATAAAPDPAPHAATAIPPAAERLAPEPGLERQAFSLSARPEPAEPVPPATSADEAFDPTGDLPQRAPPADLPPGDRPPNLDAGTPEALPPAPPPVPAPTAAVPPHAPPSQAPWVDDGTDDSAQLDHWDAVAPSRPLVLPDRPTTPARTADTTAHPPGIGQGAGAPEPPVGWATDDTRGAPDTRPGTAHARWQARTVMLGELADEVELDSDVTDPWAPPEPAAAASHGQGGRDAAFAPPARTSRSAPRPSAAEPRAGQAEPPPGGTDHAPELPEQLLRAPSRPAPTADRLHGLDEALPSLPDAADSASGFSLPASAGLSSAAAAAGLGRRPASATATSDAGPSTGSLLDEVPPSFVRHAERAAFWRSRPVRVALVLLALMLGPLAALQAALVWRDALAARLPALAEPLAAACAPLGCSLQPLRRIGQLSVEGSALNLLEDTPGPDGLRYRLSVQLRNRADFPLMAPAFELALTDAQGELVSRRVLRMSDFGARAPDTLAAQEELSLRLVLAAGPHRIEGYTVELFYP